MNELFAPKSVQPSLTDHKMQTIAKSLIKSLVVLLAITFCLNSSNVRLPVQGLRIGAESGQQDQQPLSCHLRELELCSVGIFSIFQNPNGLPAGESELRRQCEYFNESAQCFDDYARTCLTSLQLPFLSMFTTDLADLGREFCSQGSELRKNYTKHVSCLREVQRKHQRPCLTDFQVAFEPIHKINRSLRVATSCCNVNRLKECLFDRIEVECEEPAMEMINWMIEKVAGSLINMPCRDADPFGEQCEKLLPKIGTKPHNGRNVSAISKIVSGFTNVPAQ